MRVKLLEVRDRGTCMPCFAFKPNEAKEDHENDAYAKQHIVESFLVGRSGYGGNCDAVVFGSLVDPNRCQYDPYSWPHDGARTLKAAHHYVSENWGDIESGDVIDVELILGESTMKKTSEAFLNRYPESEVTT
jgi:hypothetical protein